MKSVKALLLGSAAGLMLAGGAQAQDEPTPVEYVKVCSLYGAGYYYMPGTDICLKLGGYVRYEMGSPGTSLTFGPMSGPGARNTRRDTADFGQRTRAVVTVDTRQQTAYGTLRTYVLLGYNQESNVPETTSPSVYMTRGFVQVAGFTVGKAASYFDSFSMSGYSYAYTQLATPDTSEEGKMLAAYTAQFGNGFDASFSVEQSRRRSVTFLVPGSSQFFVDNPSPSNNSLGGLSSGGTSGYPDPVLSLSVNQPWGRANIAAALHNTSGGYYGTTENLGHPADRWGFAISTGGTVNVPWASGSRFSWQGAYAEGATGYTAFTRSASTAFYRKGDSMGFGFFTDGIYTPGGQVELTTSWSVGGAYEMSWSPALRTSIYGSYLEVRHTDAAKAAICANGGSFGVGGVANGCNPDWGMYVIGSRTQWNPFPGLDIGLDVFYTNLQTAKPSNGTLVPSGGAALPTANIKDQDAWSAIFRIQRNYYD
jgi:hypothetical protein